MKWMATQMEVRGNKGGDSFFFHHSLLLFLGGTLGLQVGWL